jgi:hypothetical protein
MICRVLEISRAPNSAFVCRAAPSSACSARSTTTLGPTVVLQELAEGRRHVLCQFDRCNSQIKMSYLCHICMFIRQAGVWGRHHVVELGHTSLDQGAKLAFASCPVYLLVDIKTILLADINALQRFF